MIEPLRFKSLERSFHLEVYSVEGFVLFDQVLNVSLSLKLFLAHTFLRLPQYCPNLIYLTVSLPYHFSKRLKLSSLRIKFTKQILLARIYTFELPFEVMIHLLILFQFQIRLVQLMRERLFNEKNGLLKLRFVSARLDFTQLPEFFPHMPILFLQLDQLLILLFLLDSKKAQNLLLKYFVLLVINRLIGF